MQKSYRNRYITDSYINKRISFVFCYRLRKCQVDVWFVISVRKFHTFPYKMHTGRVTPVFRSFSIHKLFNVWKVREIMIPHLFFISSKGAQQQHQKITRGDLYLWYKSFDINENIYFLEKYYKRHCTFDGTLFFSNWSSF